MKYDAAPLVTDIRAALQIGKTESIWVALEGMLQYPEVLGNNEMDTVFLRKIIVPVGLLLRHPNFSIQLLEEMQNHPQAAVRAVAGVSVVDHYIHQNISKQALLKSCNENRVEVKICVALAMSNLSKQFPTEIDNVLHEFVVHQSDSVKVVAFQALGFMTSLPNSEMLKVLNGIAIPSDPALKASMRDCIVNIANLGNTKFVLDYFQNTVTNATSENIKDVNWVIGKSLGRSWVVKPMDEVFSLITQLAEKSSEHKQLINTLQSISRHAGIEVVKEYINSFPEVQSDNIAEFLFVANKILSK